MSEDIKSMFSSVIAGDLAGAEKEFGSIMHSRLSDRIDAEMANTANKIFNGAQESESEDGEDV